MKHYAAVVLLIGVGALQAEPAVTVNGVEGRPSATPALHLIAGEPAVIQLQLSSKMPARTSIRASLYQLASGIAAPVAKDLPVADDVALDGTAVHALAFSITPPEVQHSAAMELRFSANDGGATWRPAGSARLVVYPAGLLAQVKAMLTAAQRTGVNVVVLGESPQLKSLLRGAKLEFEEADAPSASADTLSLSQCDASAARTLLAQSPAEARLLLFTSDPALPAGVYWTARGAGFTAKVTLPVLTDLDRAPDRQFLFLTLFQQAFRTFPSSP